LFSSFPTGVICGGGGEITCLDAGGGNTADDNFGDEGGLMGPVLLGLGYNRDDLFTAGPLGAGFGGLGFGLT